VTDALTLVHRFEPGRAELPTLLLLHGTGGDETDLLPLGRMLLPDAPLLSPRGAVLERGQPRFFRRLAEGVFDMEDLHRRTSELATFVRDAAVQYRFDPRRVVAVGFSNGANIAASMMLSGTGVLAGGVLLRAMVPFEPEVRPNLVGVPVLLSAGRNDPIVPTAQVERLGVLLKEGGASVDLAWQAAGHGLTKGDVESAAAFLREHAAQFGLSSLTGRDVGEHLES
jgi:phospholipase/carboxylesterase